jgi:hypothetical protein
MYGFWGRRKLTKKNNWVPSILIVSHQALFSHQLEDVVADMAVVETKAFEMMLERAFLFF